MKLIEQNTTYKQTEIGRIPSDWEVKQFKDICWVNQGLQIAIERRLKIPTSKSKIYITIQYLNNGKEVEYIDDYTPSVCCEKDEILMTRTGNTGIVVYDIKGVFHNNFFKINYNKKIVYRNYLIHYLKDKKTQKTILDKAGTSTIPDLNHNDFYSIQIPIPTLAEQTAIATALSDTDALISSLSSLITKKRNIKQGTMQKLLQPKDGWEVISLNECLELLTDFEANGSFESVSENVTIYDNENFSWYVRATDLEKNAELNNVKFVDEKAYKFLKKTALYGGEVLITKRGEIGKVYYFQMKTDYATLAPNMYLLKLNNKVIPFYIYCFFRAEIGNKLLKEKNASSTLGALYKDDVKAIQIPLPATLSEQVRIATILSDMDAEIASLEQQLEKYKDIKQGMMQNLLTGKIRLI